MPVCLGLATGKYVDAVIRHQLIELTDLLMVHGTRQKEAEAGEVLVHYANHII